DVFLRDIWPSSEDVKRTIEDSVDSEMFARNYADVFEGDERWKGLDVPTGERFAWADESTYVRHPPFFEGLTKDPEAVTDVEGARVLVWVGDSVTTDHISPAGVIKKDSPAGAWLMEHGVEP